MLCPIFVPHTIFGHKNCASCLRKVKVICHKHPLHLIYSLEGQFKKINIREDETEITIEIEHFSHEHDLKLIKFRIMKNKMGAHEPFSLHFIVVSSVASFFINCVELHRRKRYPLHRHIN
ncbi:hypothetical protein CFP56_037339 [Quercus suber]|uniref:Uncharacterized protein n=1 Tax=Quercus suber TaxID=58331 RepID=A0AAW0J5H7_QUESU